MIYGHLPFSWKLDGTGGCTFDYAKDHFNNVIDPFDLSEEQKWALANVIVIKHNNFSYIEKYEQNYVFDQISIVHELQNRTLTGKNIRDNIIEDLSNYLYHLKNDIELYD